MLPRDIEQQVNEINELQDETTGLIQEADNLLRTAGIICTNARRAVNSFLNAFINWWGECTLNQETGDKSIVMNTIFPLAILGLIHDIDEANTLASTHPGEYQCILRRTEPNTAHCRPPIGYHLYKALQDEVPQFYVYISHPEPIESETINLSEKAPAPHILSALECLPWAELNAVAARPINLNESAERKNIELWIVSLSSSHSKTSIRFYDIFWKDEHAEKFSKHLSTETRKTQKIGITEYRPIFAEKGVWAKTVSSLGNTASYLWHWGNPPRILGHNTILNQTEAERNNEGRIGEIFPVFAHIADFFIKKNMSELDQEVRKRCQSGIRPKI